MSEPTVGGDLVLSARPATAESFTPYGRLVWAGERLRLGGEASVLVALDAKEAGPRRVRHLQRYPDARLIPGLVLFRWDAPLFFANAELFHDRVLDAVAASPTPVRRLVVAAEPVTSVDVTSADMLAELDETLHAAGIELCVAEMKDPVKDKLKRFGVFTRLGETAFFPTIGAAVSSYLATHSVDGSTRGRCVVPRDLAFPYAVPPALT